MELSKEKIGKKGIVTNVVFRNEAVLKVKNWLEKNNWIIEGFIESPIKGAKGNIEYLIHCTKILKTFFIVQMGACNNSFKFYIP